MKFSVIDNVTSDPDWDFWFEHTKLLPRKTKKSKKQSYYFILNVETNKIEYVSDTVFDILGYKPDEFSIEKLYSIVHHNDLKYCRNCEFESVQISDSLYFNEHYRYSFHYSYRVKNADNEYITIRQQYHAIEVDEYGHLLKTIVLQELIEDYDERPINDFKVFDILKNRPINLPSKYKLSKRELEILELIYKGHSSVQISEMLYLSKHTVNTHRKNILSKTSSSSVIDALKKVDL